MIADCFRFKIRFSLEGGGDGACDDDEEQLALECDEEHAVLSWIKDRLKVGRMIRQRNSTKSGMWEVEVEVEAEVGPGRMERQQ